MDVFHLDISGFVLISVDKLSGRCWCRWRGLDGCDAWTLGLHVNLAELGQEVVRGLLGVPVASPDVVLEPVRGLVGLGADGARGPRSVHAVLVSDVAG